MRSGKETNF